MFKSIYLKEFNKNLTSVSFYVFTTIILILTIMTVQNINPNMVILFPIRKEWHNAPLVIARFFAVLSVYGLFFSIVMTGRSVAKDFSSNIHSFFFTYPINKTVYLGGRFFGALSANILIFSGVIVGLVIGSSLIDPKFIGPFSLLAFAIPIVFILIPNLLLIGAIFFSLATLSRKMVLTYISGVILLMFYGLLSLGSLFIESDTIKILIDPFALSSINTITDNWTVTEINNNSLPLTGLFLLNRLIWISIGLIILFITWKKFKMVSFIENRKRNKSAFTLDENPHEGLNWKSLIVSDLNNSFSGQLYKSIHLVKKEFKRVVIHPAFIVLTILAAVTTFMNFYMNVDVGGNNYYPTTSWYLQQCRSILGFTIPMIIFFGGIIVWRERDYNSNQFFDTLPLPNWVSYVSKLTALFSVLFFYMIVIMFMGIFTQVFILGWTDLEIGLYIRWLFGIELLYYWFLSVLVIFILNLTNNKYLGFFLSSLFIAADLIIFVALRSELTILRFGHIPSFIYSDINGFGHYSEIIIWYTVHWIGVSTLFGFITALTWRRSEEVALKYRLRSLFRNIKDLQKFVLILLIVFVTGTTTFIIYNKYVLNHYISRDDLFEKRADYERKYSKFKEVLQPTMYHVALEVDFFPEERDVFIRGNYYLTNKSDERIDSIFLNLSERKISKINLLEFSKPADLVYRGTEFLFSIYELKNPLLPGDSISLKFDLEAQTEGFSDNNPKNELAANGSRINLTIWSPTEYFPTIGYESIYNLTYSSYRKKYGLPVGNLYPKPEEVIGKKSLERKPFITFDAVMSTSLSQTAITNGDLVENWTENNRNFFHYMSDTPMTCEIQLISGEYDYISEQQGDVKIEVYYNKKHPWNVNRIIRGALRGMEYCSSNFVEYPYNTFKVVEVPKYMTRGGARAQPSLIVWREDVGFLTQVDDADGIDQLFGITVHELTHNWWPDVVIPAHAEGLEMMAEAIAEYVRIITLEKEYGKNMAKKHLSREMDAYLSRRSRDLDGERPFKYALPDQYYISYQKGTAAMYALQEYIGEENVNLALRRIIERYGFSEDDHPTSINLIDEYRRVTPDSLQYLITDLFEKVTLYENEAIKAVYEKLSENNYKVNLSVECYKFHADSIGNQTAASLNDYIYIGILGENDEELYMQKHKFNSNELEFEIYVNKEPKEVGIDPNLILIDRDGENNIIDVELTTKYNSYK